MQGIICTYENQLDFEVLENVKESEYYHYLQDILYAPSSIELDGELFYELQIEIIY